MKSTKRIVALLMALVLMVGMFAACGSKPAETPAEAPAETPAEPATEEAPATEAPAAEGPFKITLVTMDLMDQHWTAVHAGAEAKATELGNVELDWMAPDAKNDAEQIEKINNAVANGAQAILVAANGPDSISSALEEAAAKGVKIIYVDSPANFPAVQTIGTDNVAAGKTAGEELLKALEAAGIKEGPIGIVSVNPSTQSTVDREAGFRGVFEGKGYELLETQYSEGDPVRSQEFAANMITQGAVGLYGTNEGSTVGVGNAIKESGAKIIGVGFDKSDVALNLIDEGFIVAIMAQNPDVMGAEGVKTAVAVLSGETPSESYVDTGVSVITKENTADFR